MQTLIFCCMCLRWPRCLIRENTVTLPALWRFALILSVCVRRIRLLILSACLALHAVAASAEILLQAPAELTALLAPYLPENPGKRAALQARLAEILATEGYFSPQFNFDQQGDTLNLRIEPGPRTQISQVSMHFTGALMPETEALLRSEWALPVGAAFRQEDWTQAKQKVLSALLAADYPGARLLESLADVDAASASAKLSVRYDAGSRYRFGQVQVEGLQRYDRALIERYNREIKPGELYSRRKLEALQDSLQATPYFSAVRVELQPDGSSAEEDGLVRAPVLITVRERAPHRFGLGLGSSSNTGHRAEVNVHTADLFSQALILDAGVRVEQKKQTAYADVFLPPDSQDRRHGLGVLSERSAIQGLRIHRNAVGVQTVKTRGRIEQRLSLNWQNEGRAADGASTETSRALVPDVQWTYRDLDDLLDPSRGLVLQGQLGGGSRAALSDQNFVRAYLRWQQYFPVGSHTSLLLGSELGYTLADSRQKIPQDYLFRAGGTGSVRGYAYQSLGVKEGEAIVGGRYLGIAKAELTHWFGEKWGVATFLDAGNAVDRLEDAHPLLGYGLGGRWRSPAGPIGVDVAYGQQNRKLHLHFSLSIPF